MSVDAARVAQAYAEIAKAANTGNPVATPDIAKPDFGALVKEAVSNTVSTIDAGEKAGLQVAAGEADLVDVVTAISAAEVSLEAAISVRNRVIEAYQEIMRMPI